MYSRKTNRKTMQKISIVIVIAILATATILMPRLNRTSVAHANTGPSSTFLRTRRGTRINPGSDRAFAAFDFQQNYNNFFHYEAFQIANLNDSRHNRTLGHQSNTITSAQNRRHISTTPLLTVITHGQGGYAADWSNCGTENRHLTFNPNSIIETLRRRGEANVYVVRSNIFEDIRCANTNLC